MMKNYDIMGFLRNNAMCDWNIFLLKASGQRFKDLSNQRKKKFAS